MSENKYILVLCTCINIDVTVSEVLCLFGIVFHVITKVSRLFAKIKCWFANVSR